jgi:hypothetical protein
VWVIFPSLLISSGCLLAPLNGFIKGDEARRHTVLIGRTTTPFHGGSKRCQPLRGYGLLDAFVTNCDVLSPLGRFSDSYALPGHLLPSLDRVLPSTHWSIGYGGHVIPGAERVKLIDQPLLIRK